MKAPRQIKNPLTLIGVFAGVAEVAGTGVLPLLTGEVQGLFVWFVMLFPVLLVGLFFGTLILKPVVIYGPADYLDEGHFVSIITGSYRAPSADGSPKLRPEEALRRFWKPDGRIDPGNERRLREWMSRHGIAPTSITIFLENGLYRAAHEKAVVDLGLDTG